MVHSALIQEVSRDDLLDDLLEDLPAEIGCRDLLGVLGRNNDGVDTERDGRTTLLAVLNRDLGLRIGTQPGKNTRAAGDGHSSVKLVGEDKRERHVLGSFVGSISKHDTLVTSTNVLK